MSCLHPELNSCGCCEHPQQPNRHNRPGLEAMHYRIGTHSSFSRSMRERAGLESVESGPQAGARTLAALGTRDLDDPSMALIDSAALMLDILTFYQERIANEGFLGTSTERLSVLELARAIGYELSPGVAADVTLVFMLDETPGKAPSQSSIDSGTRVQSLPADGGLPQTFETVDDFTAYRAWNIMVPRRLYPQSLAINDSGGLQRLAVDGTTELKEQVVVAGTSLLIDGGDLVVLHIAGRTAIRRVTATVEDTVRGVTRIHLEKPDGAVADTPTIVLSTVTPAPATTGPIPMTDAAIAAVLAVEYSESDLQLLLEDREWDVTEFLAAVNPDPADTSEPPSPHATDGVFVLRQRVGLFGHNAQPYDALPVSQREGEYSYVEDTSSVPPVPVWTFFDPVYPTSWEGNTIWENAQGTTYPDADLYLEREVDDVVGEGWIVLEGQVGSSQELRAYRIDAKKSSSLADYGLSGKVTGLDVSDPDESSPNKRSFLLRGTTAHIASEWLELAELEMPSPVENSTIELDRMVLGLAKGQDVVVTGDLEDPVGVTGTEVATLEEVKHQQGRTTLVFEDSLENEYVRDTVAVHANVVRATHGETAEQPLGSGEGSVANQAFDLPTSPLTYVSAATVTGRDSTLQLRVNGRLWNQTRSLYGMGPADQVYTVRIADDATATVTFGDGVAGARPATGAENITVKYRTGIGPDGEVDAETIQLLMTRPPGVKSVDNPLPASGAEAPETFATAKRNAPMTVRTLNRVVSLTDFEDFAATFAGIGKARADVIRLHARRLVHLTVGSSTGGEVSDEKIELLVKAINKVRDPGETVCAASYRALSFDVYGYLKTDPLLEHDDVLEDVHAALRAAFSFEKRRFAQGASVAEIMNVIHDVDGVVAADIDKLEVKGASAETITVPPLGVMRARRARLPAGSTGLGCDSVVPADLLLINPNGIDLREMT